MVLKINIVRIHMIKLMLTTFLMFSLPLAAVQEETNFSHSQKNILKENLGQEKPTIFSDDADCSGCCPGRPPGMAELLQGLQLVLRGGLLLLPEVQPLIAQQVLIANFSNPAVITALAEIITTSGIGGPPGPTGPAGPPGPVGATGATGPAGGIIAFADFYALMPPDNAATVAPGGAVDFPNDGPTSGIGIIRTGAGTFNLADIGVYQIFFQVSVTEAGQLVLTLDSGAGAQELAYTVVGRATGTSQIIGMALVQTSVINSILTVSNPVGESTALTITPLAGGIDPVSAHLVITRIQ